MDGLEVFYYITVIILGLLFVFFILALIGFCISALHERWNDARHVQETARSVPLGSLGSYSSRQTSFISTVSYSADFDTSSTE